MKIFIVMLVFAGLTIPTLSIAQSADLKTREGCSIYHPALPWQQPTEASWSGICPNEFATGFGWYRFNLSGEGFPDTRVEIFMHFDNGAPANEFYYARMSTGNQKNYEGYAELGGYQISAEDCSRHADCSLIIKAKENDGKPPLPPMRPSQPPKPPTAPSAPSHAPDTDLSPVQTIKIKFLNIIQKEIPVKVNAAYEDNPLKAQEIIADFNVFGSRWVDFAHFICQRSGLELQQCEQYQLSMMYGVLSQFLNNKRENAYLPTNSFSDFGNTICGKFYDRQRSMDCLNEQMDKRISSLRKMHPKAMSVAVDAISYYASAIVQYQGYGGSTAQAETIYLRERMLQFVYEQAHGNWQN